MQGWFDRSMPDLNQENPFVLKYLIQNTIWWMEYANIDGIRVDTYPYNDVWTIPQWVQAIRDEYRTSILSASAGPIRCRNFVLAERCKKL